MENLCLMQIQIIKSLIRIRRQQLDVKKSSQATCLMYNNLDVARVKGIRGLPKSILSLFSSFDGLIC